MAEDTTNRCTCGWVMPEKMSVGVDALPETMAQTAEVLKACRFVFYVTCPKCGSDWECDGGTDGIKVKARAEA